MLIIRSFINFISHTHYNASLPYLAPKHAAMVRFLVAVITCPTFRLWEYARDDVALEWFKVFCLKRLSNEDMDAITRLFILMACSSLLQGLGETPWQARFRRHNICENHGTSRSTRYVLWPDPIAQYFPIAFERACCEFGYLESLKSHIDAYMAEEMLALRSQ